MVFCFSFPLHGVFALQSMYAQAMPLARSVTSNIEDNSRTTLRIPLHPSLVGQWNDVLPRSSCSLNGWTISPRAQQS